MLASSALEMQSYGDGSDDDSASTKTATKKVRVKYFDCLNVFVIKFRLSIAQFILSWSGCQMLFLWNHIVGAYDQNEITFVIVAHENAFRNLISPQMVVLHVSVHKC